MTDDQKRETLLWRQSLERPLHSPRHLDSGCAHYLITASCFNHTSHIGHSVRRMNEFTGAWLDVLHAHCFEVTAWVVLPNHYHALVRSGTVLVLLKWLGRLHGRTSHQWNGEEGRRGRQVWCNAAETLMKSDAHRLATLNYIHHNPVKHGYVGRWTEWPWSSASEHLSAVGREEAIRLWRRYPIDDYGQGWDDASL